MTRNSGIRNLTKSGDPAALDSEALTAPDGPPRPPAWEPTRTPFLPSPRGRQMPVVGTVVDRSALRALALSGDGWLHRDGRIVSNGSAKPMDALRAVPEMIPLIERLASETATVEAARQAELNQWFAHHMADGGTEDDFHVDDADQDYKAMIASDLPGPDVVGELRRAGWVALTLWRDHGAKTIHVEPRNVSGEHETHLRTLSTLLEAKVDLPSMWAEYERERPRHENLAGLGLDEAQIQAIRKTVGEEDEDRTPSPGR